MSGILGVFTTGELPERVNLERMVAGLAARGGERSTLWCGAGAALAVSRYEWESEAGFSGPVLELEEDDCMVAADATLYHLTDLRRRLRARGVAAWGATPSHLILAAYRAWGEECTKWLEGDFAFILWDKRERRLLVSRDFSGRRPLYYAELGETLVVGSTLGAVLAHPACPEELNLPVIAATAGLLLSAAGEETCYRAIQSMPLGGDLHWRPGAELRASRNWDPAPAAGAGELPFDRAAEELRSLLTDATRERMGPSAPTSVWLSGGWDSTAVFGIGQELLRQEGRARTGLLPVSLSYPVGDQGREDETIEQIARFWDVPVHWLDTEEIPLFSAEPAARAAARDEPLVHMYELWNRALARGSRATGARVALDGYGGDQMFQISDVFLADLLRNGRWLELAREWRSKITALGRRHLLRFTVLPLLPGWSFQLWGAITGTGPVRRSHLARPIPSWIEPEFIRRHDLVGREAALLPTPGGRDRVGTEALWMVGQPLVAQLSSQIEQFAQEQGVEVRSPLFDRRVVEFALARPRWERASRRETKYLLRRALRGLLPDEVLAPRPYRTGLTLDYSSRWMRKSYPAIFETFLRGPLILAELGIVDPAALSRAISNYLQNDPRGHYERVSLFFTIQTEWWLRSRLLPEWVGAGTALRRSLPASAAGRAAALAGAG